MGTHSDSIKSKKAIALAIFWDDPCVIGKKLEMYALENIAVKWGMVFMSCIMKYYMHCGYEQVRTYPTSFSYHVNPGLINNGLLFMVVIQD